MNLGAVRRRFPVRLVQTNTDRRSYPLQREYV